MTDPLVVKDAEYGTLRVFALDLPETERDALDPSFLGPLIGATQFRPEKAEIVDIATLGDLGLAGYLTAGYGITSAEIERDARRLRDATGYVALVPASAFDGQPQLLQPKAPAHFVGLYREEAAAPATPMAPTATTPRQPAPPELSEGPKRKGRPVVYVILGGILVLLLLLLLL